jgi:hypothetical protein
MISANPDPAKQNSGMRAVLSPSMGIAPSADCRNLRAAA